MYKVIKDATKKFKITPELQRKRVFAIFNKVTQKLTLQLTIF